MTTSGELALATPTTGPTGAARDHRGSWIPTGAMIKTRFMEMRKRRGLMIALIFVNIGIPAIFLLIRLLAHAFAPKSYGPAGGYDIFTNLVAVVMYVFGFIVAATLGCTAGSIDLSEGMFRHLVVTGRSRMALYLARIPAGLAIIVSLVAIGFAIVCTVCVLAAPTSISYNGVTVPQGLSLTSFDAWAVQHPGEVICSFDYRGPLNINVPCQYNGSGPGKMVTNPKRQPPGYVAPTPAKLRADAITIAKQNYSSYKDIFLSPSISLMVESGLWIELEAAIGFIVGLGLGSLLGQRTVAVVLMLVYEVILTPLLARAHIAHLINFQRGMVGLATGHLEPSALPLLFGGGGGGPGSNTTSVLIPETTTVAVIVIVAWIVGWTALGAWRMRTRDA